MLSKTNSNKAPGMDKLSGIFLKDGATLLASPLTQIVNLSIANQLLQSRPIEMRIFHRNERCRISAILRHRRKLF